jgi:hypothetical protein
LAGKFKLFVAIAGFHIIKEAVIGPASGEREEYTGVRIGVSGISLAAC